MIQFIPFQVIVRMCSIMCSHPVTPLLGYHCLKKLAHLLFAGDNSANCILQLLIRFDRERFPLSQQPLQVRILKKHRFIANRCIG